MKAIAASYPVLTLLFSVFLFGACTKDAGSEEGTKDILTKLQSIEGVSVVELDPADHFNRLFEIRILQPVDHRQPNGGVFSQKIYLGHVDETLPVAFETEGYARSSHRTRELSGLLNINQLAVEHRYFGESAPQPLDWQYLDIWQAANDHHHIVEIFKAVYPAAWVSSGASKGGDAAIFHRRFFPADVQATVAYVAPILFEAEDQRFLDYYNQAGDDACREKMKTFQRNMLKKIDSFPPLFIEYVNTVNKTYNTFFTFSIPYRNIVYHAMREDYAFEFWSSETENCATIPGEDATVRELFDHFVKVFDIFLFFSDYGVDFWTPWFYQAKTEIGNYAHDASHLQDLVLDIDPLASFEVATNFNPSAMKDIDDWIQTASDKMIFIYGAEDPWTVAAFNPPNKEDVIKIINPGTKHGTRINNLSSTDRLLILNKLTVWLGL